jgi:hypothetical protein
LIGSLNPISDNAIKRFVERARVPAVAEDLGAIGVQNPVSLLAREIVMAPEAVADGGLQVLDFPKLHFMAGRDFFQHAQAHFSDFEKSEKARIQTAKLEHSTLLSRWRNLKGDSDQDAQAVFNVVCGAAAQNIKDNWNQVNLLCKLAAAPMAMHSKLGDHSPFKPAAVSSLRRLHGEEKPLKSGNPRDLINEAKIFESYDSPYLQLSPQILAEETLPCFNETNPDSVVCQGAVIHALAIRGYGAMAREALSRSSSELRRSREFGQLENLVTAAFTE